MLYVESVPCGTRPPSERTLLTKLHLDRYPFRALSPTRLCYHLIAFDNEDSFQCQVGILGSIQVSGEFWRSSYNAFECLTEQTLCSIPQRVPQRIVGIFRQPHRDPPFHPNRNC